MPSSAREWPVPGRLAQHCMNIMIFGLAAIALYLLAAMRTSGIGRQGAASLSGRSPTVVIAALALGAHAAVLYPETVTGSGINLGIFNAASLVAWIIALVLVALMPRRPLPSLSVVILPFAAVVLGCSLVFSQDHVVAHAPPGIALHIAMSLLAYSLFAIAALQAAYLAFAEHRLKQHAPVLRFLPPLPTMESLMFQLTGIAFVLLSIGLAFGAWYIVDVRGQHLSHKIFFSLLAWSVFAVLLAGRRLRHWRGRRAARYVIAGFALLAVGFFGSKIALELVLDRV